MNAEEELKKLVKEKFSMDDLVEYVAFNLHNSFDIEPIKSPSPKFNGRHDLKVIAFSDIDIMRKLGLTQIVYDSIDTSDDEQPTSSYRLLTRKAEQLYRRLKREGYYRSHTKQ